MRRKINYPPFFEIEGAAFLWTNWASFGGGEDRRSFNSSCMYLVLLVMDWAGKYFARVCMEIG